jgi:hypothetical protein
LRHARLLKPDSQDPRYATRAPQVTRDSVLPAELGVFNFIDLAGCRDTADLRHEERRQQAAKRDLMMKRAGVAGLPGVRRGCFIAS